MCNAWSRLIPSTLILYSACPFATIMALCLTLQHYILLCCCLLGEFYLTVIDTWLPLLSNTLLYTQVTWLTLMHLDDEDIVTGCNINADKICCLLYNSQINYPTVNPSDANACQMPSVPIMDLLWMCLVTQPLEDAPFVYSVFRVARTCKVAWRVSHGAPCQWRRRRATVIWWSTHYQGMALCTCVLQTIK